MTARLLRLRGVLDGLPPDEGEPEDVDERYEGEVEERDALRGDREMVEGEIAVLEQLLAAVKRDRKLDELVRLIDHISAESGAARKRRCCSSPSTARRSAIWSASWKAATARGRSS